MVQRELGYGGRYPPRQQRLRIEVCAARPKPREAGGDDFGTASRLPRSVHRRDLAWTVPANNPRIGTRM